MDSYDVVVVGAGLAGLQCTRLLAGHGLRVALVDRKDSLSDAVHTTGIFVRQSLEDFALPSAHLGPPIRRVTIYSPSRRAVDLVSSRDEFRIGRMGPLYQRLLKDCQAAGADWLPATSFLSASETAAGSRVNLRSAGAERTIECRMLVGADGTNSRVARELGLSENRRWIVGLEEVYERATDTGEPRLHCFFDRRIAPGYIAWIADDGRSVHVGVGGYAAKFQPQGALDAFRGSIGAIVPLTGAELVERRGGRIPVGCVLENVVGTRGLLLGDAAGAVSPLTAGGLDPCLRLSELAAKSVYQFLSTGDPAALAVYDGRYLRKRYLARRALRRFYDLAGYNVLLEMGCAALRTGLGKHAAGKIFFNSGSSPIAPAPVVGAKLAAGRARP